MERTGRCSIYLPPPSDAFPASESRHKVGSNHVSERMGYRSSERVD